MRNFVVVPNNWCDNRDLKHQVFHGQRQTWGCDVPTVLRSRLQFTFERQEGLPAVLKCRFFCHFSASRLQTRNRFLYPPAMCWLDFWTRINELFMFLRLANWMGLLQLAVTWYMLEGKLPTGTSKTKKIQIYLDEVAFFWMSQWVACPPACTMWPLAGKGPFETLKLQSPNRKL